MPRPTAPGCWPTRNAPEGTVWPSIEAPSAITSATCATASAAIAHSTARSASTIASTSATGSSTSIAPWWPRTPGNGTGSRSYTTCVTV